MKKLIILLCFTFLPITCNAIEFTVDDRSMLHVGASAAINLGCQGFVRFTGGGTTKSSRIFCGATTFAIGLGKEFLVDGHPDYGDILFNLVGIAVSDQLFIRAFPVKGNGGGIRITKRW